MRLDFKKGEQAQGLLWSGSPAADRSTKMGVGIARASGGGISRRTRPRPWSPSCICALLGEVLGQRLGRVSSAASPVDTVAKVDCKRFYSMCLAP